MSAAPGKFFTLEPNPPVAGQPLVITYTGNSGSYEWKVDGGPVTKVTVPPRSHEIASVPAGGTLWVDDCSGSGDGFDSHPIDNPRAGATPAPK
jgi:hypothetical protein